MITKHFIPSHYPSLNLQLFAEGGDGGGTNTGGAMGESAVAAIPQTKGANNPLADVKYGIQAEEAQTADVQTAAEDDGKPAADRNAEFEKLIKGEYKDLYDAKMQDTIQRRLKSSKDTVDRYNALAPTLEMLGKKYGVDPSNIEALNKAIEEDDSYYEEEALERGMTVEHLKEVRKIERENDALKKQMNEQESRERASQLYSAWMTQAEQIKSVYPSFNLEAELTNQRFVDLLRVPGVDVRTAYEIIHRDEIIPTAMQFAVKTAEQKFANKVIANGKRPSENGLNSQAASLTKSDVSTLTAADRREIARRVAQGEKISFG